MSDTLSKSAHDNIFHRKIIPNELGNVKPAKAPKVFMLGGQPGAGKSGMKRNIEDTLAAGQMNAVKIDMDEFRIYHPSYLKFVRENPRTAAGRVQEDVRKWAEELYQEALKRRVNVIYDGTLTRQAEAMVKSADQVGFAIEVHVVATSFEASQQGVKNRYEEGNAAYNAEPNHNAPPRSVPDDVQRSAYNGIPGNLEALCKTGLVSYVRVASRSGDKVYEAVGKTKVKKDGGAQAKAALETERNRVWTAQEIAEYQGRGTQIRAKMRDRGVAPGDIDNERKNQRSVIDRKLGQLRADEREKDSWVARVIHFDVATLPTANVPQNVPQNAPQPPNLAQNAPPQPNAAQNVPPPPNLAQNNVPRRRSEPTPPPGRREREETLPRRKSAKS